jgi:hypothetical protein
MPNPYNRGGTSTTAPLLQVVTLIDNNGFAQSFATAYVPTNSVLRLVNGALQAVPDHRAV